MVCSHPISLLATSEEGPWIQCLLALGLLFRPSNQSLDIAVQGFKASKLLHKPNWAAEAMSQVTKVEVKQLLTWASLANVILSVDSPTKRFLPEDLRRILLVLPMFPGSSNELHNCLFRK